MATWMHRVLCLVILTIPLAAASAATPDDEEGFTDLFDGKTLDGWQATGNARYWVEDGAIIGQTTKGPNSFLMTKKAYADFILELEFKAEQGVNSGIQIRSEITNPRGQAPRVFGYQAEIDTSDRAWTGGIYDEARRGWLYPLNANEPARKAFKQNEWNHFRIVCVGDSIKTFLNGIPAADLVDAMTLKGFIALQCHGSDRVQKIMWRNIRIKDLGAHKWKPIFNGKTLEGWSPIGGGEWSVENGEIKGISAKSEPRHGHLFYDKQLDDFTVRVRYKINKGNSGLYFRVEKIPGAVGVRGFQAEMDENTDSGGLYETNGRAWVIQPKPDDVKKYFKPHEWNEMTVSAHGTRLVVHVNGVKTAELPNDEKGRRKGFLAVQLHGGQDMDVQFKSVELLVKE